MNKLQITQSNKKKIFLIDDSSEILLLCQMLFEKEGYQVKTAINGKNALSMLKAMKEPDIVLVDMQLDDMNGYEFVRIFQDLESGIGKRVPIVFYTGEENVELGSASGSICKSGDIENLINQVHKYITKGIVNIH
jgi:CheY-like chemotaxis protein